MSVIKLFFAGQLESGTKRYQSQLYVGKDTADFVLRPDGVMYNWGIGTKGVDFYPFEGQYKIVEEKEDMAVQPL